MNRTPNLHLSAIVHPHRCAADVCSVYLTMYTAKYGNSYLNRVNHCLVGEKRGGSVVSCGGALDARARRLGPLRACGLRTGRPSTLRRRSCTPSIRTMCGSPHAAPTARQGFLCVALSHSHTSLACCRPRDEAASLHHAPPQTRFVMKYRHVDGKVELKVTNDRVVRMRPSARRVGNQSLRPFANRRRPSPRDTRAPCAAARSA